MSIYIYRSENRNLFLWAEAWIDDPDVDAEIVWGIRELDGTAISSGTSTVAVDSMGTEVYEDSLVITGLSLVDGTAYDIFITMNASRVSASPVPSNYNAFLSRTALSTDSYNTSDKSFAFQSQVTGSDEVFYAGGYNLFSGNNDFSPFTTFGTANNAYAGHFFVVLGADAVDQITIRVSGTSITDAGVRTTSDTEDIIVLATATVDDYFETSKKWLGQVSILIAGGTPKTCNYGYCKYWDNNNSDFTLLGFDSTWFGGATDDVDLVVYHHKATGWTYNAGAEPSPPEIVRMTDDYSTDDQVIKGDFYAWKRANLNVFIDGGDSEGIILSAISTKSSSFDNGNTILKVEY